MMTLMSVRMMLLLTVDDILTFYITLTFLLISTQFKLNYFTHYTIISMDSIVDTRVYRIVH